MTIYAFIDSNLCDDHGSVLGFRPKAEWLRDDLSWVDTGKIIGGGTGGATDFRIFQKYVTSMNVFLGGNMPRGNLTDIQGWWKFDERYGTVLYDCSGNYNDGSITPGAGGWIEAVPPDTFPIRGAYDFDGLATSIAIVPNGDTLDLPSGVEVLFTISAFIKYDTHTQSDTPIIKRKYSTANGDSGYELAITNNNSATSNIRFTLHWDNGASIDTYEFSTTTLPLSVSTWHRIYVVFDKDRSPDEMKIFVDGIEQTVSGTVVGLSGSSSTNLFLGWDNNTRYFKGIIDDVRVHSDDLSEIIEENGQNAIEYLSLYSGGGSLSGLQYIFAFSENFWNIEEEFNYYNWEKVDEEYIVTMHPFYNKLTQITELPTRIITSFGIKDQDINFESYYVPNLQFVDIPHLNLSYYPEEENISD